MTRIRRNGFQILAYISRNHLFSRISRGLAVLGVLGILEVLGVLGILAVLGVLGIKNRGKGA